MNSRRGNNDWAGGKVVYGTLTIKDGEKRTVEFEGMEGEEGG